jgi:hypothetical protein
MINVKLFRIITGEEVIAELLSETEETITIQNSLVVLPTNNGLGFAPWASVISRDKPEINISKNHIVYIVEAQEEVSKKYNEMFGSKLITPNEKKLVF